MEKRLDRRRKYYMILDTETATLPFVNEYAKEDANLKKKIAIAKPLVYDFGYQIVDARGKVYRRRSYVVSEIFSVPAVFNTAYFASKRQIYLDRIASGETTVKPWNEIIEIFLRDLSEVYAVGAYNAMFDFKKAIPFTEKYIKALYGDYATYERKQRFACQMIVEGKARNNEKQFDGEHFIFRGKKYRLFDLWGLSCQHILDNDEYRDACVKNNWRTPGGYFQTGAEKTFAFVSANDEFSEVHTAIEDTEIESEIFSVIAKKTRNKFEYGIIYFPFKILGKFDEYAE